jgi:hypothetical protein
VETPLPLSEVVAGRLKEFFAQKQLNTHRASQRLGYGNSTKLHKILSGSQGPSLQTLAELVATFPDLSLDWLIRGTQPAGAAVAGAAPDEQPLPFHAVTSGRAVAVTVDRTGHENILHIPAQAQARYPHSHNDPAYLRDLLPYSLPLFASATYRSFEVVGDQMSGTFAPGDLVVGQFVERWDLLPPGHCYVVVLTDQVLVRRLPAAIRNRRDLVELVSDHRAYPVHPVPAADIVELWQVRAVVSPHVPASGTAAPELMGQLLAALGADPEATRRALEGRATDDAPAQFGRSFGPPKAA